MLQVLTFDIDCICRMGTPTFTLIPSLSSSPIQITEENQDCSQNEDINAFQWAQSQDNYPTPFRDVTNFHDPRVPRHKPPPLRPRPAHASSAFCSESPPLRQL